MNQLNQNFCIIKANKLYQEIYDEITDEELNANKPEYFSQVKRIIENKIMTSNKISLCENYSSNETFINDILENIIHDFENKNLQGDTLLVFCDDTCTYDMIVIQDLSTNQFDNNDLNEFASLVNIEFLPVYWNVAIIKTSYINNEPRLTIINKKDIGNIFINLIYHTGVVIDVDGTITDIEFTGDDPFLIIGPNFEHFNSFEIVGFTMFPFVEKTKSNKLNEIASKLMGQQIYSRVCFVLLCPTTNKRYFNLTSNTIKNILSVIDDKTIVKNIESDSLNKEFAKNPFIVLKKNLCKN